VITAPPRTELTTDTTTSTAKPWKVLVWDDPVTPMVVVTLIFKKIFGYPEEKATHLMLQVHHQGKAVVWSGDAERAQKYCVALQTHGLLSTIEQDD
jgi:ATP-dependent Clp protease adaptor protein ClpS